MKIYNEEWNSLELKQISLTYSFAESFKKRANNLLQVEFFEFAFNLFGHFHIGAILHDGFHGVVHANHRRLLNEESFIHSWDYVIPVGYLMRHDIGMNLAMFFYLLIKTFSDQRSRLARVPEIEFTTDQNNWTRNRFGCRRTISPLIKLNIIFCSFKIQNKYSLNEFVSQMNGFLLMLGKRLFLVAFYGIQIS